MPTKRAFIASVAVAFVVLSMLAGNGGTRRIITGTIAQLEAGEWIFVTNEGSRIVITLRETTVYGDSPAAALKPGVRVTVWYRRVAERRPVADKVRVLSETATR